MSDWRSADGWDRVRASLWFRPAPWLVPFALIALGVLVNMLTPRGDVFTATFAAAPLVAAAMWSLRGTLAVGLVSFSVLTVLVFTWDRFEGYGAVLRLGTVFLVALLSLAMNDALRRGNRKLASARAIAEAAQRALLPDPPARVGDVAIAVRYRAGQAGARIGGDLYAVQNTRFGVRMLVGDVRGKGLPAVGTVAVVLGAFREAADREAGLAAVAEWIDHALERESNRSRWSEPAEEFVTAVLAEISAGTPDRVRVVNRGHPAPLLLSPDGSVRLLEPRVYALPLGMDVPGASPPEAQDHPLSADALLLLHTDGVTEARDPDGVFYDPVKSLSGRRFEAPDDLLDALLADLDRHTRRRIQDDVAMLAVSRGTSRRR
ncbi:serine/threonine-protein phosphatase [Yinghuangia sp. ASG 101]|uniref:PP2C family protein-serine/threonine phosphatase n=1 Tax=Yinghuangia sp. ASG 101 TaxID=2896848 RepID=UPI001E4C0564|nr:PP2C family protein-serine/threonine phosphatase [Yinghuangia sp. ASG 101]UGQ11658.1 serine/threonine-protein phosphatase [Yinghuangia sp. ASG 101]